MFGKGTRRTGEGEKEKINKVGIYCINAQKYHDETHYCILFIYTNIKISTKVVLCCQIHWVLSNYTVAYK